MTNDELERQAFEAACRDGLLNGGMAADDKGNYYSTLTFSVWKGWMARARQESNHSFDDKALESARKIMALVYGQMPPGGSVQLQAQIQVEIIAAMQWAAPDRK